MNRYYYDFHIHSCLSPCADNDMTPNNIAGMAALAGLQLVALTDHNSCKNCPAFFEAAKKQGIIPVAGVELTTAEDIHTVCLFPSLDEAMAFDVALQPYRILIPNRTDIFGDQLIMDGEDRVIGTEEFLLSNATTVSLEEAPSLVKRFGGVCYPAHVDREANGMIATLGDFPEDSDFTLAELHDGEKQEEYRKKYPVLSKKRILVSSDAHYLWDIRDKTCYLELADEPYSSDLVRNRLFALLKGALQ
ncbi:MAG: PHP domain-containing protein [Clostridia bacterium]|nr:PHP domain-containing protein [Clostridia bacterium]